MPVLSRAGPESGSGVRKASGFAARAPEKGAKAKDGWKGGREVPATKGWFATNGCAGAFKKKAYGISRKASAMTRTLGQTLPSQGKRRQNLRRVP